ncbi:alpha/beta fold hydrolase [Bradyrhizobium sp. LHD-71]|uniref:alpha/beta fold hydrolase n=1 Tax=Bradyrhizobium sp. LHD-71 TaxID=3072141 RepID=UPI00280C58B7|nr:alpha/beta fold hydrolase [Bradyrhizobium sp. LHD-71]MDQ8728394.1 alpha/beta fold hydrolase [Bradyrhizobium sp. LHD-71]
MTVADLQDKSLANLDIKPHPTIAEWDEKAERIETPLSKGRIVWRKWGSGPPLVFFHGGSGSWTHWIRNIPDLSREYTVYAVDLPGMGDSDPFSDDDLKLLAGETNDFRDPLDPSWQPPPIAMAALSRILAGALETMIPTEAINLVGFSFGGMTAANVTARIPQRIRRLVLSGAAGLVQRDPTMKPLATWRFAATEAELAKVQRQNVGILMLHDPKSIDDLAVNVQMRNGLRTLSRKPPRHFTTLASLERAKPSLAAIWGRFDAISGWQVDQIRETFLQLDPGCQFHVVENGGHWVAYERADEFNRVLKTMLRHD